jgi:hypothetical protein
VRELVHADTVRREDAGTVAQVFLQPYHLHVGAAGASVQQGANQLALPDVCRPGQLRLVAMGLERQPVELLADVIAAGIQSFG